MHAGEADYLITYDGVEYSLHGMARRGLLALSGLNPIPVEYQTARGYKQDGLTVLDSRLNTRAVGLTIKDSADCREDYWLDRRYRLLEALRMNRGGALTYLKVLPDGSVRAIDGWLQTGPTVQNDQGSPDALSYQAAFQLLCPDPTFYDPTAETVALVTQAGAQLVFPITFPIWFGGDESFLGATITYTGTWRSYPTLTITGPYNWLRLENTSTLASFVLSTPKVAGEIITLNLTPGQQQIVDAFGNVLDETPADGSLIDWYLAPDPEVDDGENVISVSGAETDAGTAVTIDYYTRYVAL